MSDTVLVKVETDEGPIFINGTHFAGMTKDEAVKAIVADGITKDKDWAAKAWSASRKQVHEKTGVSEEDQEKKAQLKLEELNRTRAASGVEPVKDATTLDVPPAKDGLIADKNKKQ